MSLPPPALAAEVQDALETSATLSRTRVAVLAGSVFIGFVVLGIYYAIGRHQDTFDSWLWYISTGFGLLGTLVLGALFYRASNRLPAKISREMIDLVANLQSPLAGYETVTRKIIEVCQSAEHYYWAATRMPLIGAISDGPYCQEYQAAITGLILGRVRTELVCLEDEPLYEFIRTAAPQGFAVEGAEANVREFLETQLPSYARSQGTRVELARSPHMPIQMAIADGNRGIIYFSPKKDLSRDAAISGFYTTNRDIISALMVGFNYIQKEATVTFSTLQGSPEDQGSGFSFPVGVTRRPSQPEDTK